MFRLERILVPVDFSDNSLAAVSTAAALARRLHSEVTLLHVNEFGLLQALRGPMEHSITSSEAERVDYLNRCRKELEEVGAAELSEIAAKRMVCCGDPAKVIANFALDRKSDLVLMPTHGLGEFRKFLLGSVTAKVLHDVSCPVWTCVHADEPHESLPVEIRHVMCAVNLTPRSVTAIRWAAAFAMQFGAMLTVMHAVLETPPQLPDLYTYQWHEESHWAAEQRLHGLLLDANVQAECLVTGDGDIPRTIAEVAKEKEAGLLVIARSCAGDGTKRLGSSTCAILCDVPCPVVSL